MISIYGPWNYFHFPNVMVSYNNVPCKIKHEFLRNCTNALFCPILVAFVCG